MPKIPEVDKFIEITKDLVDLFDNLQEEINFYRFTNLLVGIHKSPEEYYQNQLKRTGTVNSGIERIIKKHAKTIQDQAQKAFKEANKAASEGVSNLDNAAVVDEPSQEDILKSINEKLSVLSSTQKKATTPIANLVYDEARKSWFDTGEKHLEKMHKAVEKAYEVGVDKMTKVTYQNGRTVSFKTYIEMATRTEVADYTNAQIERAASRLGVVFYLCSHLGDCAPDHAPYQGKVYVVKNWRSIIPSDRQKEVEGIIAKQKMLTLEYVRDEGKYKTPIGREYLIALGRRPNCRHVFSPITIEQAKNPGATLQELGLKSADDYSKDKYIASQQLRKLERKTRTLKEEKKRIEYEIEKTPAGPEKARLEAELKKVTHSISLSQKETRELIKKNDSLTRDYKRENPSRVRYNLGVKK